VKRRELERERERSFAVVGFWLEALMAGHGGERLVITVAEDEQFCVRMESQRDPSGTFTQAWSETLLDAVEEMLAIKRDQLELREREGRR